MRAVSEATLDLAGLTRAERTAACKVFLDEKRALIALQHEAGDAGSVTARAWAFAVDEVVRALFAAAAESLAHPPLVLLAVGGYGRAELCPASDLDLWFLTARAPGHDVEALAEDVLYPLWDLKLAVGHAARSVEDCVTLAREDLTAATALLDTRRIAGEAGLHDELLERSRRARNPEELVKQLVIEKTDRHARFGDTVYLLEPDVKNGQGAYRDLLTGLWAAKARFGVSDFSDLVRLGQATERSVKQLADARDFFLRVRTAAHLAMRRRQDRLTFEVQEAIAPKLFPVESAAPEESVGPSVERLMRTYYLHAKAVTREGERLLERCGEAPAKKPTVRRIDASFVLWNGLLSTAGPEVFRDRPAEMVRIFRVALDLGVAIYGHTKGLIAEQCQQDPARAAEQLARDPAAARDFCALLIDDRDGRNPLVPPFLEQMHDLGLLVALIPAFGPCTARVQHDIYHVFTVDQHSLYAVGRLKSLARGDLARELPTATEAMAAVTRKLPLYLGTLLHDVGKPLGKAHSEKGAVIAEAVGKQLDMSPADVALTELLVRKHLVLAHLSQRRDLSDVAMIARLAEDLADEETLRSLYLLTIADMSMVAPGNMTAWKEQLLRELYSRTMAHLRHGPDLAGVDPSQTVSERRRKAARILGEPDDQFTAWATGLPDRYFAQTSSSLIARHAELSRARAPGEVAVDAAHHSTAARTGWSELSVIADDTPGLLARIAGALVASKIDVMSAQIAGRMEGGRVEAIDVFLVRDRLGRPLTDDKVAAVQQDLTRLVRGELSVAALLDARRERSQLKARKTPDVATEVRIDAEVSADYTVVDVYTHDRPGVLFTITHTLSSLGLDIGLSKVATEAERVADIFYVRHSDGRKLAPAEHETLRARLIESLAELSEAAVTESNRGAEA